MNGDVEDTSRHAYFTVDGTKATSFTFVVNGDQIAATDFSTINLIDAQTGNTFTAPVVTDADGEAAEATIVKALENIAGNDVACYALSDVGFKDFKFSFKDGTAVTFSNVNDNTNLLFSTTGKLLAINNLREEENMVVIENGTDAIYIDDALIDIVGSGFTYMMINNRNFAIVDLKAGADVRYVEGVNQIFTIGGDLGNGIFTFGNVSYEVTGNDDGVIFNLDKNLNVTSIDGINGNESVKILGNSTLNITNSDAARQTLPSDIEVGNASSRTEAIYLVGNALDNSILGGSGRDTLYGKDGADYLESNYGNDKLSGGNGDDTFWGGSGNDTLTGGNGNDIFIYSAGNDVITDMGATDTLQIGDGSATYTKETVGSNLILTVEDSSITLTGAASLSAVNIYGKEIVPSMIFTNANTAKQTLPAEFVLGNASARSKTIYLVGNKLDNSIYGGSGKDTLYGKDGDDYINGGKGNDKLYGGNGDDTLWGGAGNDTLSGSNGNDFFIYSGGSDVITDYASGEKISLGAAITSSTLNGSDAVLIVGSGSLTIKNTSELTLIDSSGKEFTTIIGGATFTDDSDDRITLDSGIVVGDATARTVAIYLVGNKLDNSILGGTGKDTLYGKDGDDYINGGRGSDKLYGGNGNDTLWGGFGNDTLTGSNGADVFIYKSGEGRDVITDFSDDDLLKITGTFTGTYNASTNTIAFKVGSTENALTLKNFTASNFNINGNAYQINGSELVKK